MHVCSLSISIFCILLYCFCLFVFVFYFTQKEKTSEKKRKDVSCDPLSTLVKGGKYSCPWFSRSQRWRKYCRLWVDPDITHAPTWCLLPPHPRIHPQPPTSCATDIIAQKTKWNTIEFEHLVMCYRQYFNSL